MSKSTSEILVGNMKEELLKNRNDLVEGTFCYLLFEQGLFEVALLEDLISNAGEHLRRNPEPEVRELLVWVVGCVDQCFASHYDKDDLFSVKNYSEQMERTWTDVWRPAIEELI